MRNWYQVLRSKGLTDWLIGAGLFAGSFLIYVTTLAPSVATIFDDSLEFQLVCYQPGIAHPTGYPLYTLLGKLFTFLPVGDVAYRVNLMSAFFASITVALLYPSLKMITQERVPSVLGPAVFAVSPVFWSQAVIAEVYALNAAFVALTLCLLLAWARAHEETGTPSTRVFSRPKTLLSILALVYGLSLTHHRTMLLLAPVIVIFVLIVDRRVFTDGRLLVRLALLFIAPLSLYLYIPLRASTMSPLDGVYQRTLQGFINHITARSYVTMFVTENPVQETRDLAFYVGLLRAQFTLAGTILGGVGLAWSFRRPKRASLLALSFAIMSIFVAVYHVPDIEVFLIPLFAIFSLWIGTGFASLWDLFTALWARLSTRRRPRVETVLYILLLLGGLLPPLYLWRANRAEVDLSRDWDVHDYGTDMLSQPLEDGAVVVGILGEMTLLNYFQQTEGLRPDIVTISANRENRRLAVVEAETEMGRPLYLTRPLEGVEEEYHLSSLGPLIRIRKPPATLTQTPSHALSIPFGESIALAGYDADLRDTHTGQRLRVTLYWQVLAAIPEDYKVSVRLLDQEDHLGGVEEAFPVRNAYRTWAWRPGETILDTYDVPVLAGIPPGDYVVQVTMYRPDTLEPVASVGVGKVFVGGTVGLERAGAWDVQKEVIANLEGQLTLLGYSIIGESFKPGDAIPLTFLWEGLAALHDEYRLSIWLEDEAGVRWGQSALALGGAYPPDNWQRGQVVRDWQTLLVPANLGGGSYRLKMQVLADGKALHRTYWFLVAGSVLDLGGIEVQGRQRSFDVPLMEHSVDLRLGESVKLLGYDLTPADTSPGGTVHVTLYWQALQTMDTSYTVFLHLLDEGGTIRGQRDNVPGQGALPTSGWVEGEVITDEYYISVAPDAPPGPYTIALGMYDLATGVRLPAYDSKGNSLGDHTTVSGIQLSGG